MRRIVTLIAALSVLAACDAGGAEPPDDPTTTAGPPATMTGSPPTTTTSVAARSECSDGSIPNRVALMPELPAAVNETRGALIALAAACDLDALDAMAVEGSIPFGYDLPTSFATPGALWAALQQSRRRPMAVLVTLLNYQYFVEEDDRGARYVWPAVDGGSTEDRPLVAIAEDGEWLYFILTEHLVSEGLPSWSSG